MVDGSVQKETEFFDKDSGKFIKITLSVRDIVLFRLLERIAERL